MQTVVKTEKNRYKIITQQYLTGLYVAIYRNGEAIPTQLTSHEKEERYHKKLRKEYPDFLVEESSNI